MLSTQIQSDFFNCLSWSIEVGLIAFVELCAQPRVHWCNLANCPSSCRVLRFGRFVISGLIRVLWRAARRPAFCLRLTKDKMMIVNGLLNVKIEKSKKQLTRYLIFNYSYLFAVSMLADTSYSLAPSDFNLSFSYLSCSLASLDLK